MSNIFFCNNSFNLNNKYKNTKLVYVGNNNNNINFIRHFPSANIEWSNSIYAFNKSFTIHLPFIDKMVVKLIKCYFNFFNPKVENKINFLNSGVKSRRLSINRIFVSKANIKHTNTKIIITIYIYNRQKKYYYNKLNKINSILQLNDTKLLKKLKLEGESIIAQVNKEKKLLTDIIELYNCDIFNGYKEKIFEDFIKKSLEKEMLKIIYNNLLYFNKSKFENTYLFKLNDLISQFYKKKVEFNIINLEYIHLNSDILFESILIKLKKRNNRLLQVLKTSLNMVKLPYLNKLSVSNNLNKIKYDKLLSLNNIQNLYGLLQIFDRKHNNIDEFDQILKNIFPYFYKYKKEEDIQKSILNCIKDKSISGVRIEAAGRLSRRLIAARSVFKLKYKGSLKNIDSSYKGFSSIILRGNVKSNIQYTNINSKTRNGSFGIKGWISSV
jgi:Mitochondrial ribosomal protein (VAR1)